MILVVVAVPADRVDDLQNHIAAWLKSAPGTKWHATVSSEPSKPVDPWPQQPAVDAAAKVWSALGASERALLDRLQSTTVKYERKGTKIFRAEAEAQQLAVMCEASGPIEIAQTAGSIENACRASGYESCLIVRFVDDIDATTITFSENARRAFLRLK